MGNSPERGAAGSVVDRRRDGEAVARRRPARLLREAGPRGGCGVACRAILGLYAELYAAALHDRGGELSGIPFLRRVRSRIQAQKRNLFRNATRPLAGGSLVSSCFSSSAPLTRTATCAISCTGLPPARPSGAALAFPARQFEVKPEEEPHVLSSQLLCQPNGAPWPSRVVVITDVIW